ncbi:hypothetical protein RHODO2019_13620 [Rhodococcus antarcticus]|uniref:DUF1345 domain-containing protein n=1 Tax=Rhodococcus antarcticus TaxID=2987751 RepID=A0ABY6NZ20_9NOCA|nr:hypothetical protein [Rhodococcus antarcticus]UZJ24188.1 hypothetical protein RHODO2019_13620 [Rhodococcus antarcticus]
MSTPPVPAWRRETPGENRLAAAGAVLVAVVLQLLVAQQFSLVEPRWLLPALELVLLGVLLVLNPRRLTRHVVLARRLNVLLVALISLDNGASAVLLDAGIVNGTVGDSAGALLASALAIYLTNVIAFATWYWEIDRGGPFARAAGEDPYPDFLFAQMTQPHLAAADWEPTFVDYLYLSLTNATAFSPTDTLPLTRGVKLLMALQSLVALTTTALVVARAVNVL